MSGRERRLSAATLGWSMVFRFSSQSAPRSDQDEPDVASLVPHEWPTAEQGRSNGSARDPHADPRVAVRPEGADDLAAIRPGEASADASVDVAGVRPSLGRRMVRTVIAVLIGVGATLAWQSYGDEAKELIATMAPSLRPFLFISAAKPPLDARVATQNAAGAQSAPNAQNAAPAAPANSAIPPQPVQQQIETMTGDLAAVRASLDQLAAKQEEMAQNIAALQAIEQDIKQKLSSPPASQAVPMPRRKPPHVARSTAAPSSPVQSSSVPPPPEPVPPPPGEQPAPPRPPMPLH